MEQKFECEHEYENYYILDTIRQSKKVKKCIFCGEVKDEED